MSTNSSVSFVDPSVIASTVEPEANVGSTNPVVSVGSVSPDLYVSSTSPHINLLAVAPETSIGFVDARIDAVLDPNLLLRTFRDTITLSLAIYPVRNVLHDNAENVGFAEEISFDLAFSLVDFLGVDDLSASDYLDIDYQMHKTNVFIMGDAAVIAFSRLVPDALSVTDIVLISAGKLLLDLVYAGDSMIYTIEDVANSIVNAHPVNSFELNS